MSNAPSYNTGAFSGIDYNSLMNNPYLYMAMMSPNLNFKAGQATQTQGTQSAAVAQTAASNNGAIPVAPAAQESSGGVGVVEGVLATALIGGGALWMLKSGKFSKAGKALKTLVGKNETGTTTVLKHMRAVKNKNGDLQIQVPGKTKTVYGKNIQPLVDEYGVTGAISAERQAFNPTKSVLDTFKVKIGTDEYVIVHTQNGQITKVVDFTGKDTLNVLKDANATTQQKDLLERLNKIVTELGKDSKNVDKSLLKDVSHISYTNKFDDDVLKLTIKEYGQNPSLKSYTTLEQFDRTHPAVKAYSPTSAEEVFGGELVNKTGSWFNKKGVLVDGVGVVRCEKNIAGAKCYFEGNNLVKIEQGTETYTSSSIGFKEFVKDNKEAIEAFKKDVFEDRIASEIPVGAVIGTV